jgi:cell division protein FtsB
MRLETRRVPLPPTDVVMVLICTAAIFFVLAFGGKALEGYRLQRHNAMLLAELDQLRQEQQQLEAQLKYVQTPEYIEKVAREQYKWVKTGETLIITILRQRPSAAATSASATPTVRADNPAGSQWSEWWKLLTGGSRR